MQKINVYPGTNFFEIFQKVIKQVEYPKEDITFVLNNKNKDKYKCEFQWQDENTCGVDIYKV